MPTETVPETSDLKTPPERRGDILGYARVSTGEQNPDAQRDRLTEAGAIRVFTDVATTRRAPDFTDQSPKPEHGRRERRSIWVSSELNDYLDFPGVGQVFAVRRDTVEVKSGKQRCEIAYGVTSLTSEVASPERLLALNRGHWTIEATHHILDWSFDEDRSRIRSGHGPENMTRLRRFAIGVIKGRGLAVAETMRNLARNPRRVLDFLKMTDNVAPRPAPG